MKQCSQWRESITEKNENLNFVKELSFELNMRKDLWNHFEITVQLVQDWKNVPFKKVYSKAYYLKKNSKLI